MRSGHACDLGDNFIRRMTRLVRSAYVSERNRNEGLKLSHNLDPRITLGEMCEYLKTVNQETQLDQSAQAFYYCIVAMLLMMDGIGDNDMMLQWGSASALLSSGVLK